MSLAVPQLCIHEITNSTAAYTTSLIFRRIHRSLLDKPNLAAFSSQTVNTHLMQKDSMYTQSEGCAGSYPNACGGERCSRFQMTGLLRHHRLPLVGDRTMILSSNARIKSHTPGARMHPLHIHCLHWNPSFLWCLALTVVYGHAWWLTVFNSQTNTSIQEVQW